MHLLRERLTIGFIGGEQITVLVDQGDGICGMCMKPIPEGIERLTTAAVVPSGREVTFTACFHCLGEHAPNVVKALRAL